MKTGKWKLILGLIVVAGFAGPGQNAVAGSPAEGSDVRFRLVHDTIIIVSTTANGQGPFDFVLDTGTNTTVVDTELARRLSLASVDRIELTTVAGSRTLERSSMPSLSLGAVRLTNVEALIEDLDGFRKLDSRIQGVVGQNFFSHFNYFIDFRRRTIRFEQTTEIRDAIAGERVPIDQADDRMMLSSTIQSRWRAQVHLVLDSGANLMVLFQKSAGLPDAEPAQGLMDLHADGSKIQTRTGRIRELTVGSTLLRNLAVALPPAAAGDNERTVDGLLPMALFHTLYVNNREAFIVFNPRVSE
jgi:hypothetical protein